MTKRLGLQFLFVLQRQFGIRISSSPRIILFDDFILIITEIHFVYHINCLIELSKLMLIQEKGKSKGKSKLKKLTNVHDVHCQRRAWKLVEH